MRNRSSLDFTLMRGGTSKGIFLRAQDVPQEREALVPLLLDLFGSPDRRQIDGLGGADKLTSKVAIIGPPTVDSADLDYLFGQVGIHSAEVDFNLNCGNLTAAVGSYAIWNGLVPAVDGTALVRIHNVNTGRVIHAHVPVSDGQPVEEGSLTIGGVPGTGAPIALDFSRAAGAITGSLLPLKETITRLEVDGYAPLDVSVVDCANLVVFVEAEAVGMTGTETPSQIDGNPRLVAHLNAIRKAVAHRVGLGEYWDSRETPSTPMCVVVSPPRTYTTFSTGETIAADAIDLLCRQFSTGATSKALAATVTSCVGVACRLPGTLAARHLRANTSQAEPIRIGHPSGVIKVEAAVSGNGAAMHIDKAQIWRTARLLAEGRAYLKKQGIPS